MQFLSDPALLDILPAIGVLYLFFSMIAFFNYARDKSAARKGLRRTSEQRLLLPPPDLTTSSDLLS